MKGSQKMAVCHIVTIPSEAKRLNDRLLLSDYYLANSTYKLTLSDDLLNTSRSWSRGTMVEPR